MYLDGVGIRLPQSVIAVRLAGITTRNSSSQKMKKIVMFSNTAFIYFIIIAQNFEHYIS